MDASADVQPPPPPVCPNGPAPQPRLIAHTGLHAVDIESAPRAGDEFLASISVDQGSSFRIVALSACGAVREIVSEQPGAPMTALAADDEGQLFASNLAGVYRAPLSGGALTRLTSETGAIAVDHANVYVAAGDHVTRLPRPSGAPQLFVSARATDLALDATYVYLSFSGGVSRVAKDDPSQILALAPPDFAHPYWWNVRQLALDETRVFYADAQSAGDVVCFVPKIGGASSCSTPMPEVRGLLWGNALFYRAAGAIDELPNIDAPAIALAKPNVATMWVDDASVWWLTADGDFYRIDK